MNENDIHEIMEVFFSNPHNRLVMAMFGVHDGDMTVKEALEFARNEIKVKKNLKFAFNLAKTLSFLEASKIIFEQSPDDKLGEI